jgi:hypothetical protein
MPAEGLSSVFLLPLCCSGELGKQEITTEGPRSLWSNPQGYYVDFVNGFYQLKDRRQ